MIRLLLADKFDPVFALMKASFPNDEYRPYEEQKALLSLPEYRIYAWEETENLCAFAAVWALDRFSFNEYPYLQPAISKGKQPVPFRIMTSGRSVDRAEFEQIRRELYLRVYHV